MPGPSLVKPAPLMTLPSTSVPLATSMILPGVLSSNSPDRLAEPPPVSPRRLPLRMTLSVTDEPPRLASSSTAPLKTSVSLPAPAAPSAAPCCSRRSVPDSTLVRPVKVDARPKVAVPAPVFRTVPDPVIIGVALPPSPTRTTAPACSGKTERVLPFKFTEPLVSSPICSTALFRARNDWMALASSSGVRTMVVPLE